MEAEHFELHYYLRDGSHSIDALVRNKCEMEILGAVIEIAKQLGIPVQIETEAYAEGGLKELWRFLGKNQVQLTLLITAAALVFSRFPVKDAELDSLDKEQKRLEIEKTRLEIEELRKRSGQTSAVDKAEAAAEIVANNPKIHVRRSNYYRHLLDYPKVERVGFRPDGTTRGQELVVERSDFYRFVMRSDKLPPEVDENALIEVLAPVLAEGNYQWRGYYRGKPISFAMLDPAFKAAILAKEVHFQHGSRIRCILQIHRKLDEVGEILTTGYSVPTVLDVSEDGATFAETPQGRASRHTRAVRDGQQQLFGGNEGAT